LIILLYSLSSNGWGNIYSGRYHKARENAQCFISSIGWDVLRQGLQAMQHTRRVRRCEPVTQGQPA
jgi:hypothetical protein